MATNMRKMITDSGARYAHRRLERGLELVLQRTDNRWRLALGRTDVQPSDDEIAICRRAFGVPAGTDEVRTHKQRVNLKTDTTTNMYVCEMVWMEA